MWFLKAKRWLVSGRFLTLVKDPEMALCCSPPGTIEMQTEEFLKWRLRVDEKNCTAHDNGSLSSWEWSGWNNCCCDTTRGLHHSRHFSRLSMKLDYANVAFVAERETYWITFGKWNFVGCTACLRKKFMLRPLLIKICRGGMGQSTAAAATLK